MAKAVFVAIIAIALLMVPVALFVFNALGDAASVLK